MQPRALPPSLVAALVILAACGDDGAAPDDAGLADAATDAGVDAAPEPFAPDLECPGDPTCEGDGDGVLHAGAAMAAITPVFDDSTEVMTVDVNDNDHFDAGEDEFRDTDGDGSFDAIWMAGYRNGRPADGVSDDQWARALALRRGDTTVVLVSLDVVGYFYDEVLEVRELVSDLDVDWVSMGSTHTHEAKDTIGIWGRSPFETGWDPEYMERIREAAAQAIRDAVAALEPARVQYASFRLRDQPGGTLRYVSDSRHPHVLDDQVRVLRFADAAGETISTLVNMGAHPEYAGSRNRLLSSDFPHWLRQGIEEGVAGPGGDDREGVGGITVFVNGAIGAQIGPNRVEAQRWDGTPVDEASLERAQVVGEQLAWFVLGALGPDGGSVTDETAELGVRTRTLFLDVQNKKYHFAILSELFFREGYHWNPDRPLVPDVNEPDALTEIAVLDIGRAQFVTIPGELDPVLFLGGYDGAYTPEGVPLIDESTENPPDLSMAPGPPYLRDLMREDAEYRGVFGLWNDFLGYLLPSFDYELDPSAPYFDEAPGKHYEETNSLGPDAWPNLERELELLLAWPEEPAGP